jgi:hypothetical protein
LLARWRLELFILPITPCLSLIFVGRGEGLIRLAQGGRR